VAAERQPDQPALVDTHCHLDFNSFDADRELVIQWAREAGVLRIVNPGIDLPSSRAAQALAVDYPAVYAAVGVHPNSAATWGADSLPALRDLAGMEKVVAIGEIGLDYYRQHASHDVQRRVLLTQLELAAERGLPVILHCREAFADLLAILAEWRAGLVAAGSALAGRPGVLHSFSGDEAQATAALDLGFMIGLTGPVTFSKAASLQRLAGSLPLDKLLVETDAPFLAPHPQRGRRNEPAYVRLIAGKIAQLKEQPLETVVQATSANAARLFNWSNLD
jgi:TatD DNase family protein